jgi:iron complex transport system ATP-binding protein
MDEPTSALDFGNQAKFLRLIAGLKDEGKTVIFTTHNPNHVMDLECNVLMIKNGSIMTAGNSKDIMTNNNILELYGEGIGLSPDGTHFFFDLG